MKRVETKNLAGYCGFYCGVCEYTEHIEIQKSEDFEKCKKFKKFTKICKGLGIDLIRNMKEIKEKGIEK